MKKQKTRNVAVILVMFLLMGAFFNKPHALPPGDSSVFVVIDRPEGEEWERRCCLGSRLIPRGKSPTGNPIFYVTVKPAYPLFIDLMGEQTHRNGTKGPAEATWDTPELTDAGGWTLKKAEQSLQLAWGKNGWNYNAKGMLVSCCPDAAEPKEIEITATLPDLDDCPAHTLVLRLYRNGH
jgi:hypothetical protein